MKGTQSTSPGREDNSDFSVTQDFIFGQNEERSRELLYGERNLIGAIGDGNSY
jgi:hypothetical protein